MWTNILIVVVFAYILWSLPIVVMHVFPSLRLKYESWTMGKKEAWVRGLENGELIFKSDEDVYFHAIDEKAIPILIDKEEGERLWKQGKQITYDDKD